MDKYFSLYLDLTRFLAAIFVVIAHFIQYGILGEELSYFIPELGREAVMIFFVLSGYVIAFVTKIKKQTLKQYAIARASRIYSVALPLLLVSFLTVFIYSQLGNDNQTFNQINKAYLYIPFHSLFLGEIWTYSKRPPWLVVYWSLCYEVWYYIFFASIYFLTGLQRIIISSLIFLFIGYKLWLLLPIWFSGVFLFKYQNKIVTNKVIARFGWLLSIVALCLFKYHDVDIYLRELGNQIWPFNDFKLGSAEKYLSDYIICLLVLLNFYFALYSRFSSLLKIEKYIRTLATYTFTLYLTHFYIMSVWQHLYQYNPYSVFDIINLSISIGVATYIFGMVTEHKRYIFKQLFEMIYQKTLGKFNFDIENPNNKNKITKS